MGNTQSFETPIEHPRFSKVQYAANRDCMLVRQPLFSKTKQLDEWAEKRKLLAHVYSSPAIFACKDYHIEQKGACSDSGIFIGRFEGVFEKTLKQQIKLRSQQERYFAEQDIWYFILLVCKCASEVYEHGSHHFLGNIHPHNILLSRRGQYKLIVANYSFSLPGLLDHFRDFQIHGDSQAFVSPQMMGFLYSTKYADYPNYPKCINKQTAEAFSLGMTLLSMASLSQQLNKVYKRYAPINRNRQSSSGSSGMDTSTNSIHSLGGNHSKIILTSLSKEPSLSSTAPDYLSTLLSKIKNKYSSVLYQLILGLIEKDPDSRVGIDKTYRQLLMPIQRNILIFDNGWIQKLGQSDFVNEAQSLDNNKSKEICQKWVRYQSHILKEE